MEAIGSGLVIIIDGHDIRHSNIADIPEGNPMSIENLKVHLCAKGNGFLVHERKFVERMAKETTPIMTDWD
jgi:cyanophycinase